MELFILDDLFRRITLIDTFESFIWTERFQAEGDFEMKLASNRTNKSIFKVGSWVSMNKSYRVMQIRKVVDVTEADGQAYLRVSGRSLEGLLRDRVAMQSFYVGEPPEGWKLEKTPVEIARQLFHDVCVTGILNVKDIIPNVTEGVPPWPSNLPYSTTPVSAMVSPTNLYDAIVQICGTWEMGFRLLRLNDDINLSWDVYSGSDRTSGQSLLPAVIFSPQLDNFSNISEVLTIEDTKNVAYVLGAAKVLEVYPEDAPPTISGVNRNVLIVDAKDINAIDFPNVDAALTQRGLEALAAHRSFQGFDGEVRQDSGYLYQRDYFLGDLVELRQGTGSSNTMRVTEQIFVSDGEGERMYPTLQIQQYVDLGSWFARDPTQNWVSLDANPTTWSQQV